MPVGFSCSGSPGIIPNCPPTPTGLSLSPLPNIIFSFSQSLSLSVSILFLFFRSFSICCCHQPNRGYFLNPSIPSLSHLQSAKSSYSQHQMEMHMNLIDNYKYATGLLQLHRLARHFLFFFFFYRVKVSNSVNVWVLVGLLASRVCSSVSCVSHPRTYLHVCCQVIMRWISPVGSKTMEKYGKGN